MKRILIYLLNKTGYFIILDVEEMTGNKDWTHYSMNLSFWTKKKSLDNLFINGEPANIKDFAVWSRNLQVEEVKELIK